MRTMFYHTRSAGITPAVTPARLSMGGEHASPWAGPRFKGGEVGGVRRREGWGRGERAAISARGGSGNATESIPAKIAARCVPHFGC